MNAAVISIATKMSPANDSKTFPPPKKDNNPDDNANLNNFNNCARGQCTGAIPKTKTISNSINSKPSCSYIKVNNNVDNGTKKCEDNSKPCQPDNVSRNNKIFTYPDSVKYPCLPLAPSPDRYFTFNEDSNSTDTDTANDDAISIGDDGCIYTYKGDMASAFMNIEPEEPLNNGIGAQNRPSSGSCSPEMDYLEMDFDPGLLCDYDSDLEPHSPDVEILENNDDAMNRTFSDMKVKESPKPEEASKTQQAIIQDLSEPGPSGLQKKSRTKTAEEACSKLQLQLSSITPDVSNSHKQNHNHKHPLSSSRYCSKESESSPDSDSETSRPGQSDRSATHHRFSRSKCSKSRRLTSSEPVHYSTNSTAIISQECQPTTSSGNNGISTSSNKFPLPKSSVPSVPFVAATVCKLHQGSNGNLLSPCTPSPTSSNAASPSTETSSAAAAVASSTIVPSSFPNTSKSRKTSSVTTKKQEEGFIFEPCIEQAMVWTEAEASAKQTMQIAPSACGATAVINVLSAFGMEIPPVQRVIEAVPTRKRANDAPMLEYLNSRSRAGSTHADLIQGLETLSNGTLYARFFHMFPERNVSLTSWLSYWIKNGAVPIATINLQRGLSPESEIPDAWHHQMIYGVGPKGVYLTNPLECKDSGLLWHQLSSDSVLLIRRSDILEHWKENTDIRELMRIRDQRWRKINVVGQIAHMVRETLRPPTQAGTITQHVRIPASYSSGITLVVRKNSAEYAQLSQIGELPLLEMYSQKQRKC